MDKKARQDAEYLATLKTATSEDPSKELDAMRSAQAQTGAAYVVLSGKNAGLGPSAGRSQAPR